MGVNVEHEIYLFRCTASKLIFGVDTSFEGQSELCALLPI